MINALVKKLLRESTGFASVRQINTYLKENVSAIQRSWLMEHPVGAQLIVMLTRGYVFAILDTFVILMEIAFLTVILDHVLPLLSRTAKEIAYAHQLKLMLLMCAVVLKDSNLIPRRIYVIVLVGKF